MVSTAFPQNFPIRNRVIAAWSTGILVVKGRSTAGRRSRQSWPSIRSGTVCRPWQYHIQDELGAESVSKQGAKLVQEWNDVVTELPPEARRRLNRKRPQPHPRENQGCGRKGRSESSARPGGALGRWVEPVEGGVGYHIDHL